MTTAHAAYSTGLLQPEHHERLVSNLDSYARDAGIQPHWIYTPLGKSFSAPEIDYIKRFRRLERTAGLVYVGKAPGIAVEQHMAAIAGCLVRNYIRARVVTLGALVEDHESLAVADISALLVPNFYLSANSVSGWQQQIVYDTLLARAMNNRQTILYVSDVTEMAACYGHQFKRLIDESYLRVNL